MGFMDTFNLIKAKVKYATGNKYQKEGLKKKIEYYEQNKGLTPEEKAVRIKEKIKEDEEKANYNRLKIIEDENKANSNYNFATGDEIAEMSDDKFTRYANTTTSKWDEKLSYGTDELVMNKIIRDKYHITSISYDEILEAYRVNIPRKKGYEQDATTYIIGDLTILNEVGEPLFDARDSSMDNIDKSMTIILNEYGLRDTVMLYQILHAMKTGNNLEIEEIEYERSKDKERE